MRDTQRKGDTASAQAIATFTKMGYDVAIPFTESAAYDLIVDFHGILKRVQVRYSTNGEVDLRRIHSNSKGYVIKKPAENIYDWLYIYKASSNEEFLVVGCPAGRRSLKPDARYSLISVLNTLKGVQK